MMARIDAHYRLKKIFVAIKNARRTNQPMRDEWANEIFSVADQLISKEKTYIDRKQKAAGEQE